MVIVMRKLLLHVNNKGADQSVHPHSLISVIVIHLLESIISILASAKISTFQQHPVVEQESLSLSQKPRRQGPNNGTFVLITGLKKSMCPFAMASTSCCRMCKIFDCFQCKLLKTHMGM